MAETTLQPPAPSRVAAIDAYRGFVMFLMMAEVLHLSGMAEAFPNDQCGSSSLCTRPTSSGRAARYTT